MEEAESQALELAQEAALERFDTDHQFTARDIRTLHGIWLGPIYAWAGEYRSVNISKAGFQFAHAPLIENLMAELERNSLRQHTPCRAANDGNVAQALAEVHGELILVHPSEYLVNCINKPHHLSAHEHITHIGQANSWRMERETAIRRIDAKQDSFYTLDGRTGSKVYIGVVREAGKAPYLRTHADGKWNDNLLAQQECGTTCDLIR